MGLAEQRRWWEGRTLVAMEPGAGLQRAAHDRGETGRRARRRGPHWAPAPSQARHVPLTHGEVQGSHFQDGETEARSGYRACALNRKATRPSAMIDVAPPVRVLSQPYQSTQNPPISPRGQPAPHRVTVCVRPRKRPVRGPAAATGERSRRRPGARKAHPDSAFKVRVIAVWIFSRI